MDRKMEGMWINAGKTMVPLVLEAHPAPWLRKEFECGSFEKAVIRLCGLGFHELYINGKKADDRVLAPNTTIYDRHCAYIDYEVSHLLKPGRNAVAVLLGNGWYNCFNHDNEERAPWRDWPKLRCDVLLDGKVVEKSDLTWKWHESALSFDSLRCGEVFDARKDLPGVSEVGFDDSDWEQAGRAMPPGGILVAEDEEPCRIVRVLEPVDRWELDPYRIVFDFGANIAGWCEIEVSGTEGSEITLLHGEKCRANGAVTVEEEKVIVRGGAFQTDRYILNGSEVERYQPRFTFHGFRYVEVNIKGDVSIRKITAKFIRTDFASLGKVQTSSETLNRLQDMTRRSYEGNFVMFPTDCPHREKNGWTGDAQLVCRTGCWNFKPQLGYRHYLRMLVDVQRTSGELPGFTPTAGWSFNWGNGPAYDCVLFEMPYQLWLFFNDTDVIREFYDPMRRYLDFCHDMEEPDGLIHFGLGDWCHSRYSAPQPAELIVTGYYFECAKRMAVFAALLGKDDEAKEYQALVERIRKNFLAAFHHADGSYGIGVETALAAPLYFGLAGDDAEKTAALLADAVRAHDHKAHFGIMGAKFVPRMLAEYGYIDDAYKVITQPEMPGWGYWVKRNSTTLWETWNGKDSHNHIMFGDISAWMYEYLGGIVPTEAGAGFRSFRLKPMFPGEMDHFDVSYDSVAGRIASAWKRQGDAVEYRFTVPEGSSAELILPGAAPEIVTGTGVRIVK